MKNIVLISTLALALAACGTPVQPPAPTVTGEWTGTATDENNTYTLFMTFNQTNTPNPGDFTGTYRFARTDGTAVPLTGNVNTGVVAIRGETLVMDCQGVFTGVTRYNATCIASNRGATLQTTVVMNKLP